jgi:hypothetical protein
LIVALLIKGASVSYITEKLTGNLKLCAIASVLVIIYPADTMQLSFRGLHINWALSLALLGSALFLYALSLRRKSYACLASLLSSALFSSACFMYEASLLLACIPVLMLFTRDGALATLTHVKQKLVEHAIWFIGALSYVIYSVRTAPLVNSYQASVVGSDLLSTLKITYPKLFTVGLLRSTLGGWFDAVRISTQEFSSYSYVIVASVILILIIAAILKLGTSKNNLSTDHSTLALNIRLGISGTTLILLGYFPFLISYSHLVISQRTFLFATPGAALLLLSILNIGFSLSKPLTNVCVCFFFVTGISFQIYQFHHYVDISKKQSAVLNEISQKFDGNTENKTLLILDYGNQLNYRWMFIKESLSGSLTYLYNKPITDIQVCHMPSKHWQESDSLGRKGRCIEGTQDWTFEYPTTVSGPDFPASVQPESLVIPKSSIITVELGKTNDGSDKTNAESSLQGIAAKRNENIVSLLNAESRFVKFQDTIINDKYDWTFGKWWSMEIPTHGTGWRETEWDVHSFYHQPTAWKNEKYSNLVFEFKPDSEKIYELRGDFTIFAGAAPKSSMVITLNGTELSLQWSDNGEFHAMINPGVLKSGSNNLEFNSPTDDNYYGLSARLAGIHIARQP